MSYQEKRAIVSLVSSVLITAIYSVYMVPYYPPADPYSAAIFHFWGSFFFSLILVSIVAKIIIYIIFSIINTLATHEAEPTITDERDHLIALKATRNALYVFVLGVVLAMGALVISLPPSVMFIILICAGVASEVSSELSEFYFYRRGV